MGYRNKAARWVSVVVLCLLVALGVSRRLRGQATPIRVEPIEQAEVAEYTRQLNLLFAQRERFIGFLARKYKVEMDRYGYDVASGQFIPRPAEKK